jgi:hypothetical protein
MELGWDIITLAFRELKGPIPGALYHHYINGKLPVYFGPCVERVVRGGNVGRIFYWGLLLEHLSSRDISWRWGLS